MNIQARLDLTVRSFAYVAEQLVRSSTALASSARHELILREAEKHRAALRLIQRNVIEMTGQELRKQALTKIESNRLRKSVTQATAQAQQAINRIAAQYAPHKVAA